jgi:1-aminocyclopropane-1-carboxylate deaminase
MPKQTFDIPLHQIHDAVTAKHKINLYVLRTDLNHEYISGNKLFKLKYNIEEAKRQNKNTLLTFGGAYSNHIAATAAAGKEYGLKTIGIIRGDKLVVLNPTLQFAIEQGMELHYVSREEYRNKYAKEFSISLNQKFSNFYLIPEGGSNELGIKGCKEILNYINIPFDIICCACGTGTTLTGIILGLKTAEKALGFQVLKSEGYIKSEIEKWLDLFEERNKNNWKINEDYHFGGYAKRKPELIAFMDRFEKENNISLDFIYTGKMMYGIYDLIEKGYFKENETIIAVHTGGLQGNLGFL